MSYLEVIDREHGQFDAKVLKEKGLELRESYVNADPFPHIVIDDFLPASILDLCLEQFPAAPDPASMSFDRAQERYKTSFNPDFLPPAVRSFFYSLNSRPFVQFLENMTGIKGLIPDPFFLGGGFHQTTNGGHLSVHADFNLHPGLKLERRLNALIYLNRGWDVSYGGALELWDRQMQRCVKKVAPEFGRCVVFSTDATSYHGHPDPVAHPGGVPRRSIALYYYTATWDGEKRSFTTQFKKRPQSKDAIDLEVKSRELMSDLLPPILFRNLRKVANRLKRSPN
ncbi:MAG: 2OG-Fe(II) oxygenase [Pseudomonadota bacterium]|nr:2OG-Fe(II) oxygenase [Pseudomonadota bacterium]